MTRYTLQRFAYVAAFSLLVSTAHAQAGGDKSSIIDSDEALSDETAKAHFLAGKGYYRAGRFSEAGDEFMKSHELSKRPDLLFNAYVAYRDAGDDKKAANALRAYLASGAEIQNRTNLEARLQTFDQRIAALEQQQRALEQKQIETEAAQREAEAAKTNQSDEAGVATGGDSGGGGAGIAPWVLVGVGGAAIVGGIVTGLITNGTVSNVEDACPNERCPASFDLEGERDSAETTALLTDVLLIGGVALAAGGLIWHLLDQPIEETPASAYCTGDGCGAFVKGTF